MTLSEIISILPPYKNAISELDEQYILTFLKLLGFKDKEGSKMSLKELSEKHRVYLLFPKELYDQIDLTQLYVPRKLIINVSNYTNTITVYGEDELKDYPAIDNVEFNLEKPIFSLRKE